MVLMPSSTGAGGKQCGSDAAPLLCRRLAHLQGACPAVVPADICEGTLLPAHGSACTCCIYTPEQPSMGCVKRNVQQMCKAYAMPEIFAIGHSCNGYSAQVRLYHRVPGKRHGDYYRPGILHRGLQCEGAHSFG